MCWQNENYTKELVCKSFWHAESTAPQMDRGLHLLDVFRKAIVRDLYRGSTQDLLEPGLPAVAVKSATELRDAGIAFVQPDRRGIAFDNGVLSLPALHVERTTEVVYLNMIAFERLSPYTSLKVSSYIAFMAGLISSVKDVAWLRSEKLIETTLVDDEDVARLMNELSKDVCYDPYSSLCKVRDSLNWQYELGMRKWSRRLREWRKNFKETYFKNPWTFISLIAAVGLLSLTVVQTYYTVLPRAKND